MVLTTCALLIACGSWPAAAASASPGLSDVAAVAVADAASSQAPVSAPAQDPADQKAEQKEPSTPPHTGIHALFYGLAEDFKHLPSRPNLYIAVGGGALAASVHPFDATFNRRLISHFDTVNTAFKPGQWVGQTPMQMGAASNNGAL